jgi:hypothetical protein
VDRGVSIPLNGNEGKRLHPLQSNRHPRA